MKTDFRKRNNSKTGLYISFDLLLLFYHLDLIYIFLFNFKAWSAYMYRLNSTLDDGVISAVGSAPWLVNSHHIKLLVNSDHNGELEMEHD